MPEYTIHLGVYRDGFAVYAIRTSDNRVVSSCTGIYNLERARQRASEYHFSFGQAPITEQLD